MPQHLSTCFPHFFQTSVLSKRHFPLCFVTLSFQRLLTPRTAAHQAPLSMGFFRQKYWSGLPFSTPGDVPDPWIKPPSLCFLHCRQILYPPNIWEAVLLLQKGIFQSWVQLKKHPLQSCQLSTQDRTWFITGKHSKRANG